MVRKKEEKGSSVSRNGGPNCALQMSAQHIQHKGIEETDMNPAKKKYACGLIQSLVTMCAGMPSVCRAHITLIHCGN